MRPHVAKSLENERNHFVVSLPTLDTPSWDGHPQFRFHAIDGTLTVAEQRSKKFKKWFRVKLWCGGGPCEVGNGFNS